MKLLKLIDKYSFIDRHSSKVYHRVHTYPGLDNRVLIESTEPYKDGRIWRTWYCPDVATHKGFKTKALKGKLKIFDGVGGTHSLAGWLDWYIHHRNKS